MQTPNERVSSLLKNKVFEDTFENKNKGRIDHIALSRWADLVLVLPATANFISKLSRGSADDLASTIILALISRVLPELFLKI